MAHPWPGSLSPLRPGAWNHSTTISSSACTKSCATAATKSWNWKPAAMLLSGGLYWLFRQLF
jgi:hypothetical protein